LFRAAAFVELMAMWVAWGYPFVRKRFSRPKRESNVMAPRATRGLLLQTAAMFFAWLRVPHTAEPALWRVVLSAAAAPAGVVFGWLALRHLGKQWRILAGLYPDHELVQTGPYSVVRHPVYASMFLMMIATGLQLAWWPLLVLAIVMYAVGTEIRIRGEEGLLRERFGEEFEAYKRRVPAYIPFLR